MSSVSHLSLLIVLALYACLQKADGVKCEKDSDCLQTDFTLPKCQEDGVCQCKAPYQPITSGCGKKIAKPTISFEGASSMMVWAYEDASALLDCSTSDLPSYSNDYIPSIRTTWKYGEEELQQKSSSLSITISSTTVASPYTCAVIASEVGPISSEFSDPFKITMLKDKDLPDGSWKPKLQVKKKAMAGVKLPMTCGNYPKGKSLGFDDKYYTTESSSPIQTHTSYIFKNNVELYCKVSLKSDNTTSRESERVIVARAENLAGVTISISGEHASTYTFKTGVTKKLECQDNGDVAFDSSAVEYVWKIGSKTVPGKVGNYSFTFTKPGSTTYKCSMKVGDRDPVESNSITITVEDEPLPDPVIEITPKVAAPGSPVSLAFGKKDSTGSLTYSWKKASQLWLFPVTILGQSDRVIQYYNVGFFMNAYQCLATTKDGYTASSLRTAITVKPNKPTLTVTNSPKFYYRGESYKLNCTTEPTDITLTYTFFRNGRALSAYGGSVSKFWEVKSTDSGNYTCKADLYESCSDASNSVMISFVAPGKHCDTKDDCKGKEFSGSCTDSRCVCQSGYKAEGSVCSMSPGKHCDTKDDCKGKELSGNCTGSRCVCQSGYKAEGSGCAMISPGKHCDTKDDCKGKEFSGSCTNSRCVCQSGYKAEGSGCSISSATLLKVSLLGLAFALTLSLRIL